MLCSLHFVVNHSVCPQASAMRTTGHMAPRSCPRPARRRRSTMTCAQSRRSTPLFWKEWPTSNMEALRMLMACCYSDRAAPVPLKTHISGARLLAMLMQPTRMLRWRLPFTTLLATAVVRATVLGPLRFACCLGRRWQRRWRWRCRREGKRRKNGSSVNSGPVRVPSAPCPEPFFGTRDTFERWVSTKCAGSRAKTNNTHRYDNCFKAVPEPKSQKKKTSTK